MEHIMKESFRAISPKEMASGISIMEILLKAIMIRLLFHWMRINWVLNSFGLNRYELLMAF